ncbi:hypothetical protein [Streptomyces sp. NPDC048442]|uniref:hypothetical protein n=1 Tax=Streptomyces sp. NPDC048442 TaxID=3154823 RepID=UPI00342E701D
MITQTTHRPPATDYERTSDNRLAIESMLDCLPLPSPTVIVRPGAVYVTVSDVDDLGEWLQSRGGYIHISPARDGLELWTLITSTTPRPDGTTVPVRVSVAVPEGEQVMDYIRAAVTG